MKDYKVGDTIYVKGTVGRTDDTRNPCYVEFGYGVEGWISRDTIIDELPTAEPIKPVLPKKVGEELDIAKNELQSSFDGYITDVLDHQGSFRNSFEYYSIHFEVIDKLADAWRYGYTVEKEPRYKVYVTGTNKQYMYVKRGELAKAHNKKATPITPQSINNYLTAGGNRDLYWFTDEEITKFDLQDCEKELVADD